MLTRIYFSVRRGHPELTPAQAWILASKLVRGL